MTDTNLILREIKLLREAVEDMREELDKVPKRLKPRKKACPTKEAVMAYAESRGRSDLADKFYDYYNETDWKDNKDKPVYNWKGKFLQWEKYNPAPDNERTLWS